MSFLDNALFGKGGDLHATTGRLGSNPAAPAGPKPELPPSPPHGASQVLRKAAQHIEDRAAARDQPHGERSMKRTVDAFNALTGHQLSERDGWMFMVVLKAARACATPTGLEDDFEDMSSYAALAGECAAHHRTTKCADDKL